ncbi:MAG: DUF3788 domain-containing protein [Acidobacteriia bacterium]|nr:DUF3788 domain-containing protein [Terriglobia bacterium]
MREELVMLANAFVDKPKKPTDAELTAALGPAKALWDQLLAGLAERCNAGDREWSSYSRKAGWSLRVKHKQRVILYLSPCRGCFRASFALGDKAVQAARQSGLPASVVKIIDQAKRYAEGTAVRIEVKAAKDIAVVERLAAVKLEN